MTIGRGVATSRSKTPQPVAAAIHPKGFSDRLLAKQGNIVTHNESKSSQTNGVRILIATEHAQDLNSTFPSSPAKNCGLGYVVPSPNEASRLLAEVSRAARLARLAQV